MSHNHVGLMSQHIENLLDRRQTTTSFYLTINTGIAAVIGLILSSKSSLDEAVLWLTILMLLVVGFVATWIWRSLLNQYEILLGWWYAQLREKEESLPESERLITREYNDLYGGNPGKGRRVGITTQERTLTRVLSVLYVIFILGTLWTLAARITPS